MLLAKPCNYVVEMGCTQYSRIDYTVWLKLLNESYECTTSVLARSLYRIDRPIYLSCHVLYSIELSIDLYSIPELLDGRCYYATGYPYKIRPHVSAHLQSMLQCLLGGTRHDQFKPTAYCTIACANYGTLGALSMPSTGTTSAKRVYLHSVTLPAPPLCPLTA